MTSAIIVLGLLGLASYSWSDESEPVWIRLLWGAALPGGLLGAWTLLVALPMWLWGS